jgi:hypothetical protein
MADRTYVIKRRERRVQYKGIILLGNDYGGKEAINYGNQKITLLLEMFLYV